MSIVISAVSGHSDGSHGSSTHGLRGVVIVAVIRRQRVVVCVHGLRREHIGVHRQRTVVLRQRGVLRRQRGVIISVDSRRCLVR